MNKSVFKILLGFLIITGIFLFIYNVIYLPKKTDYIENKINNKLSENNWKQYFSDINYKNLDINTSKSIAKCKVEKNSNKIECKINDIFINDRNQVEYKFDVKIKDIEEFENIKDTRFNNELDFSNINIKVNDKRASLKKVKIDNVFVNLKVKDKTRYKIKIDVNRIKLIYSKKDKSSLPNFNINLTSDNGYTRLNFNSKTIKVEYKINKETAIMEINLFSTFMKNIKNNSYINIEYLNNFRSILKLYLSDNDIDILFKKDNLEQVISNFRPLVSQYLNLINLKLEDKSFENLKEYILNKNNNKNKIKIEINRIKNNNINIE